MRNCNNNGILTAYRAETGEQLSMVRVSTTTAAPEPELPCAPSGHVFGLVQPAAERRGAP